MTGADHREIAPVKRGDLDHIKALRNGYEACVNAAEVEVGIGVDQLGDAPPVGRPEGLGYKVAGRDGLVEASFGRRSELTINQPSGLGDHQGGRDERSGMALQK